MINFMSIDYDVLIKRNARKTKKIMHESYKSLWICEEDDWCIIYLIILFRINYHIFS